MVVKLKKTFLIVILLFIAGCSQAKDFNYGMSQLNAVNAKYNVTMETYPESFEKIDSMRNEMGELKKLQVQSGQEPFSYVVNYRLLNLDAERLYIEGQKYGLGGTTKQGFGCKSRPLITESAALRNKSALKGFEAVSLLREFIDKYPYEANLVPLSLKNALFLNATFYQISKDAKRDSGVINQFCPVNITLGLYQEEFRKRTNMSEDYINGLNYDDAASIWKNIRGIN